MRKKTEYDNDASDLNEEETKRVFYYENVIDVDLICEHKIICLQCFVEVYMEGKV